VKSWLEAISSQLLRAFAEMPQDTLIEDQRRAGKARPK